MKSTTRTITLQDIAESLGLTYSGAYHRARAAEVGEKRGGTWWFTPAEVERLRGAPSRGRPRKTR